MNLNKGKFINIFVLFFIIVFIFLIAFNYARDTALTKEISYNEFIKLLENKEISKVVIDDENLIITTNENNTDYNGKTLYTANINDENLIPQLNTFGVDYSGKRSRETPIFDFIFKWIMPSLTIICFIMPCLIVYLIWRNFSLKKENQKLLIQLRDLLKNKN